MRTLALAILLAAALSYSAGAQTQPTTAAFSDSSAEIESLLPQLSSDEWAARQSAQDKLVLLGDLAKPRLERLVREAKDPETRTRAEAAIALIDENRLTGPSLITLHVKDAPPAKVFEEIARQALTTLKTAPDDLWTLPQGVNLPRVSLDADKEPFWSVLRRACKAANLRVQHQGGERGLVIHAGGGSDPFDAPVSYHGPFMVIANSASQTNSINFGQGPNPVIQPQVMRSLNLSFFVYSEPKLQILGHSYMARLTEATDDKGHSMLGVRQYNDYTADGSGMWNISAMLNIPKDAGTRLTRLKGSTRVVIQTQSITWEVTDILTARRRTKYINGRFFAYNEIAQGDGGYTVKLTVTRDLNSNVNINFESYSGLNTLQLLDDKGRAFQRRNNNAAAGADPTRIEYSVTFAKNTDEDPTSTPSKLVWKLPVETRDLDVPFEFKDLPLP